MKSRLGIVLLVVSAGLLGTGAALAQEAGEDPGPGQTRHLSSVAAEAGVSESEVESLRQDGAGWGEIRHGYALAAAEGITVDEAITRIRNGQVEGRPPWAGQPKDKGHATPADGEVRVPPGQLKQASRIAATTSLTPAEAMDLKGQGYGWGLIRNAADLAVTEGISLADALDQLADADVADED